MSEKLHETEVKLHIPDLAALADRILAAGGILTAARVFEQNVRYDDEHYRLDKAGSVLRLRQDSRVRLTYKDGERIIGSFGSTRFEAEVEVSDFRTMEIILMCLGYTAIWRYEKYRTTYAFMGCEIVLDEMPFGSFAEIEGEDDQIGAVLHTLGLQDAPRFTASYASLFRMVRERLGLPFGDLTFANFQGIHVPPEAFIG
ncbi:MAG: class IV adenylate cyclase [Anaerolineae bacterium]|nr:class IV adenylate cyclase [Anaerolineae bacterium]NUQ06503.1 class IV adenylate cyclase [Anaerolineae bacterium]